MIRSFPPPRVPSIPGVRHPQPTRTSPELISPVAPTPGLAWLPSSVQYVSRSFEPVIFSFIPFRKCEASTRHPSNDGNPFFGLQMTVKTPSSAPVHLGKHALLAFLCRSESVEACSKILGDSSALTINIIGIPLPPTTVHSAPRSASDVERRVLLDLAAMYYSRRLVPPGELIFKTHVYATSKQPSKHSINLTFTPLSLAVHQGSYAWRQNI